VKIKPPASTGHGGSRCLDGRGGAVALAFPSLRSRSCILHRICCVRLPPRHPLAAAASHFAIATSPACSRPLRNSWLGILGWSTSPRRCLSAASLAGPSRSSRPGFARSVWRQVKVYPVPVDPRKIGPGGPQPGSMDVWLVTGDLASARMVHHTRPYLSATSSSRSAPPNSRPGRRADSCPDLQSPLRSPPPASGWEP
jgi:hypothetical protein